MIDVKERQNKKALFPIFVNLDGILSEDKDSQSQKAWFPIRVTLSGRETEESEQQSLNVRSSMTVTFSGISIEIREIQRLKALSPMLSTLSGRVIEVKDVQPEKAPSSICVTPSGTVNSFASLSPKYLTKVFPSLLTPLGIISLLSAIPILPNLNRTKGRLAKSSKRNLHCIGPLTPSQANTSENKLFKVSLASTDLSKILQLTKIVIRA